MLQHVIWYIEAALDKRRQVLVDKDVFDEIVTTYSQPWLSPTDRINQVLSLFNWTVQERKKKIRINKP